MAAPAALFPRHQVLPPPRHLLYCIPLHSALPTLLQHHCLLAAFLTNRYVMHSLPLFSLCLCGCFGAAKQVRSGHVGRVRPQRGRYFDLCTAHLLNFSAMRRLDKVTLGDRVGVGSRIWTAYLSTPHLIRPINILEDQLIHHSTLPHPRRLCLAG